MILKRDTIKTENSVSRSKLFGTIQARCIKEMPMLELQKSWKLLGLDSLIGGLRTGRRQAECGP